jgi:catechol 2,3-dioxygenase-like lactoylglutathione lyase family enzyme
MMRMSDVAVTVTDAKSSARWWVEKLGFETHTLGGPGGHAIMVAPPGERFLLHLCEGFEDVEPGNTGIGFVTDDVEEQVRRMEEAGVHFVQPLSQGSGAPGAKFADPDGNIFWIIGLPGEFILRETGRRAGVPTALKKKTRRPSRGAKARKR